MNPISNPFKITKRFLKTLAFLAVASAAPQLQLQQPLRTQIVSQQQPLRTQILTTQQIPLAQYQTTGQYQPINYQTVQALPINYQTVQAVQPQFSYQPIQTVQTLPVNQVRIAQVSLVDKAGQAIDTIIKCDCR